MHIQLTQKTHLSDLYVLKAFLVQIAGKFQLLTDVNAFSTDELFSQYGYDLVSHTVNSSFPTGICSCNASLAKW